MGSTPSIALTVPSAVAVSDCDALCGGQRGMGGAAVNGSKERQPKRRARQLRTDVQTKSEKCTALTRAAVAVWSGESVTLQQWVDEERSAT